jgi:hypothetical protein
VNEALFAVAGRPRSSETFKFVFGHLDLVNIVQLLRHSGPRIANYDANEHAPELSYLTNSLVDGFLRLWTRTGYGTASEVFTEQSSGPFRPISRKISLTERPGVRPAALNLWSAPKAASFSMLN